MTKPKPTTETALATTGDTTQDILASLVLKGDLSGLNDAQAAEYYGMLCKRLGLDPATQPFALLKLSGKEVMYATKGATDQLARLHKVNRTITDRRDVADVHIVTVRAELPDGRTEESTGAVTIGSAKGDALCNALMKAETKAKRRATLSILGLGMLDESEIETIPRDRVQRPAYTTETLRDGTELKFWNPNGPAEPEPQAAPYTPSEPDRYDRAERSLNEAADQAAPAPTDLENEIVGVCTRLNAAGDSIKWTGITLSQYIGSTVGDGTEPVALAELHPGAQAELRDELKLRLQTLLADDPDQNFEHAVAADGVD